MKPWMTQHRMYSKKEATTLNKFMIINIYQKNIQNEVFDHAQQAFTLWSPFPNVSLMSEWSSLLWLHIQAIISFETTMKGTNYGQVSKESRLLFHCSLAIALLIQIIAKI